MSKEKKQSNKKNTSKKNNITNKIQEEKVTNTKLTKAKKKEEEKKSNIRILDSIEEDLEEEMIEDEEYDYDEDLEEDFDEIDEDTEDEEINDEDIDDEIEEEFEEDINDEEIDEDTEDEEIEEEEFEDDDEEIEEEIIEEKSSKSKKKEKEKKKEKNDSKEKIKKIEKIAKEKKAKTKANNKKLTEILLFLDKNRYPIYAFIGGVLITTLIAMIFWPDRIAALKNGEEPVAKVGDKTYTANELYENMKDYYSVSLLLDNIDNDLLTKLYPKDDEMTKEVESNAEYYLNMYKQYYGYTEEKFLEANGFSNYNEFIEYLTLDHRRQKYLDEYVEKKLTDKEIEKYYDKNVFGDINVQHVLVEFSSNTEESEEDALTEDEAKKLAEEIITKLNDGTTWEKIQKDYKDKITYEDLSYQSWDASLEESFMTALKDMENNSYSDEPVKTSYGYHVIYRIDQKETPTLKDTKEKIIENLITDKKAEDSNLLYKALISLRKEKNIEFSDTVMKEKYETYCEQYK